LRTTCVLTLLACLTPRLGRAEDAPVADAPAAARLIPDVRPEPVPARDPAKIESSIARGVRFLLADQNADGSWGTAERTKDLNIYAPVPGAHQAFRAAVTALCVSALIETGDKASPVQSAIDRGQTWLLENLPKVRRNSPDALYNVWAHGYGIQALVRLDRRRPDDPQLHERIKSLIAGQIDLLERYASVDGGWGYYDFRVRAKQPSSSSTSFMNAAVLIALKEAQGLGVDVPRKLSDRAIAATLRQRKPDGSYLYGEYLKWQPMDPINRPGGSLGRSQACNVALRLWGDERITEEVFVRWLDQLFARNLWLDLGRKRPMPHSSFYAVAGYFYYFGHYYAALAIEQLPQRQRGRHFDQLVARLLPLQEKDGSWWDYPLYNYHQQYGTAFALMGLVRCRIERP
jgi:hypothetical protein